MILLRSKNCCWEIKLKTYYVILTKTFLILLTILLLLLLCWFGCGRRRVQGFRMKVAWRVAWLCMSPPCLYNIFSRAGQVRMVNLKDSSVLDIVRYIFSLGRVQLNPKNNSSLGKKRKRSMRKIFFLFQNIFCEPPAQVCCYSPEWWCVTPFWSRRRACGRRFLAGPASWYSSLSSGALVSWRDSR